MMREWFIIGWVALSLVCGLVTSVMSRTVGMAGFGSMMIGSTILQIVRVRRDS